MEEKNLVTIDLSKIGVLAKEGENFIFKPEAEKALLELLEMEKIIQSAIEQVKQQIGEAGQAINPNFKGVIGEQVRCIYRKYGAKYKYDFGKKKSLTPFLKEKVYYSVDTDRVDTYLKEVGELPDGITETEREDKLSITYTGEDGE